MINCLENCISQVSQRLRNKSIRVDSEWLSECVEHFYTENPQINILELFNSTLEQWQLSDLSDTGVPCLPNSIGNDNEDVNVNSSSSAGGLIHLNDIYAVQILYVLDIAESAYEQIRNLYNLKLDQTETEKQETNKSTNGVKKRRMLKLTVTDGFKTVTALEHFPIPSLSTKILPGCKVLLKGPMRYINKTILLKPNNIEILGGEVAKYEINNAYENVLLRQLNRPLNPNPKMEYPEIVVVEQKPPSRIPEEMTSTFDSSVNTGGSNSTSATNIEHDIFADGDDLLLNIEFDEEMIPATAEYLPPAVTATTSTVLNPIERSNTNFLQRPSSSRTSSPPSAISNKTHIEKTPTKNDFLLNNDDDDLLFENLGIEHQNNTIDLTTDDDNDEEICNNNIRPDDEIIFNEPSSSSSLLSIEQNKPKEKLLSPAPLSSPSLSPSPPPINPSQRDYEQTSPSPSPVANVEEDNILSENYKYQINNCSLVTIDQLCLLQLANELPDGATFVVKAEIDNVFKKLQIKNSQWKIGVWIRDNISDQMLQIQIKNDILNEISGFTAFELESMRKQIKDRPQIIDDITDLLVKLKESLEHLYCFMKIQYPSGGDGIASSSGSDQFNTSNASSPGMVNSGHHAADSGDVTISSGGQFPVLVEIIKISPKLDKLFEIKLKSEKINIK